MLGLSPAHWHTHWLSQQASKTAGHLPERNPLRNNARFCLRESLARVGPIALMRRVYTVSSATSHRFGVFAPARTQAQESGRGLRRPARDGEQNEQENRRVSVVHGCLLFFSLCSQPR